MGIQFKKATKRQSKLRAALIGPSGSGKTYTSLSIASSLDAPWAKRKIAVIDTEHGSASKYADIFDFDVLELDSFHPKSYIDAIHAAESEGYGTIVIDSLSHAWMGKDGALELVDRAASRGNSSNTFGAWRSVTPLHNALVESIIGAKAHVIATMRTKTEYVQEKDDRGKTVVRKVGLQPVQRDGLEYEFDLVCDINIDNKLIVGKTRIPTLSGRDFDKAGKDVADIMNEWLHSGSPEAVVEDRKEREAPKKTFESLTASLDGKSPAEAIESIRASVKSGDLEPAEASHLAVQIVEKAVSGFADEAGHQAAREALRMVKDHELTSSDVNRLAKALIARRDTVIAKSEAAAQ